MLRATIVIEGNLDDRLPSMAHLISVLAPLQLAAGHTSVRVDLSKLRYLGPDGVAMIAGSIILARKRGVLVEIVTPAGPPKLTAFLSFSGFTNQIMGGELPDPHHPENVTVPLRNHRHARHEVPAPIIALVARFAAVSEDLRQSLETAVNECVQNIEDHAESPIGGFSCARFLTGQCEIRIALIDWGRGILATMMPRYPDTSDDLKALKRVLFGGFSAKSRPHNAGRGIDNLRSVITTAFGGDLFIISGTGSAEIRGHAAPRYGPLQAGFGGTVVCFTLPVQPR